MIRVRELRGVPTIKTAINQIINSPKAYKIDEDKFIGWPLFLTIGGYCVDDMLDKIDPYRKKYRISAEDTHPNKIGHEIMPKEVIVALGYQKKAAALANMKLGILSNKIGKAITKACDHIINLEFIDEFPLKVWQTGSGTQTNMNVNEVIANLSLIHI